VRNASWRAVHLAWIPLACHKVYQDATRNDGMSDEPKKRSRAWICWHSLAAGFLHAFSVGPSDASQPSPLPPEPATLRVGSDSNRSEPLTDKPAGKRQTWKRFAWIMGTFAVVLVVLILSRKHDSEHPLAAHPGLDPLVWIGFAVVAWIITRLFDR
jgi:hypothetical protein